MSSSHGDTFDSSSTPKSNPRRARRHSIYHGTSFILGSPSSMNMMCPDDVGRDSWDRDGQRSVGGLGKKVPPMKIGGRIPVCYFRGTAFGKTRRLKF